MLIFLHKSYMQKYHHQSGKAVSGKPVWNQHNGVKFESGHAAEGIAWISPFRRLFVLGEQCEFAKKKKKKNT